MNIVPQAEPSNSEADVSNAENDSEDATTPPPKSEDQAEPNGGSGSESAHEELNPSAEESLKEQLDILQHENATLKRRLKFMSCGHYSSNSMLSKAICNVTFQNISVSARQNLEDFVNRLQECPQTLDRNDTWYLPVRRSSPSCNYSRRLGYSGSVQYYPNFSLDRSVWPLPSANNQHARAWSPPYYVRTFEDPLPRQTVEKVYVAPQGACFNCGLSDHSLSSCPKPHDSERIRRAMKEWRQQKDNPSEARYYEMVSGANVVPGQLSDNMKAALGIRDGQDPPYYVKMEIYGYPPAYYQDERVASKIKWDEYKHDDASQPEHSIDDVLQKGQTEQAGDETTQRNEENNNEARKDQIQPFSENDDTSETTPTLHSAPSTSTPPPARRRLFCYPGLNAPDFPKFPESNMMTLFSLLGAYHHYYKSRLLRRSRAPPISYSPSQLYGPPTSGRGSSHHENNALYSEPRRKVSRNSQYDRAYVDHDDDAYHRHQQRRSRHSYSE